jgi:hypothetical protein
LLRVVPRDKMDSLITIRGGFRSDLMLAEERR